MNHIYRTVWNAALGTWVAVGELARSHSSSSAATSASATAAVSLLLPSLAMAAGSVTTANSQTGSYVAPNGVTVVDIAKANSAGLSHNQYLQYNVDAKGLVLNNVTKDQLTQQSQLAGLVSGNANLDQAAKVILNEVLSNNRSVLAGYSEVLGGKADVVLVNPYGITCTGCGFINTDRVTLSTGTPFLNGDGSLGGFNVRQGDILINGSGLNAGGQQIIDLLMRSIRIEGQINGRDLGIVAGANRWDYVTRTVTGQLAAVGSSPVYAIDTALLGGMYANRIRLLATESGVGVRMAGDVAANAGDFTLSAAGQIELRNKVSAQQNIAVGGTALDIAGAALTSTQDMTLAAGNAMTLSGSALVAGGDLQVSAGSLSDTADNASLSDNNQRYAAGNLQLAIVGQAALAGTSWRSGGNWQGTVGSLSVGAAGAGLASQGSLTLGSTSGDLDLAGAAVKTAGDLELAASGALRTQAGSGQGIQSTAGDVLLRAGAGLDNAGSISADQGKTTLRASGQLRNSGQIHGATALDVADANGGASQSLSNSGKLLSEGKLSLLAAEMNNTASGWVQAAGGSRVQLASLGNSGTWLLSTAGGATADQLNVAGNLNNQGVLQSARSLDLSAGGAVDNSGQLLADDALTVASQGYRNRDAAVTQAGGTLSFDSGNVALANAGLLKAASVSLTSRAGLDNAGIITADGGATTIRASGQLANSGKIHAATALDITDADGGGSASLDNSGTLLSDGSLNLRAAATNNTVSGWIQAASGSQVRLGSLGNLGSWLLSTVGGANTDRIDVAGGLSNAGVLQSARALELTVGGAIDNSGRLLANNDLTVSANGYLNRAGAVIQAGSALHLDSGNALLGNAVTALIKAAGVSLTSGGGLDNAGMISGEIGATTIRASGQLANSGQIYGATALDIADAAGGDSQSLDNSGSLVSDGRLDLLAGAASNKASGWIQAATGSRVQLGSLGNSGTWLLSTASAARADELQIAAGLDNDGIVQSGRALDLTVGGAIANNGKLLAGSDLRIASQGYANGVGAVAQAGGALSLDSGNAVLSNAADGVLKAAEVSLTSAAGLANAGKVSAASGATTLRVSGQLDNSGQIQAATMLDIAAANGARMNLNNSGTLLSDGGLSLQAWLATNKASGWIQAASGSSVTLTGLENYGTWLLSTGSGSSDQVRVAAKLLNAGTLQSAGILNLTANGIDNQSGALIKGGSLRLNSTDGLGNAGSLVAAGDSAQLRIDGQIDNSGQVYAANLLEITDASGAASVNLLNSGLLLSDGRLVLRAAATTNLDKGWIQAADGSQVSLSSLNNTATWLLSKGSGASDDVLAVAGNIDNGGVLQSARHFELSAGSVDNRDGSLIKAASMKLASLGALNNLGQISAESGTATFRLAGKLDNSGQIYAASALDIADSNAGGSADFSNSGLLLSDGSLHIAAAAAENTAKGQIQAASASQLELGSLVNKGVWLLSTAAGTSDDNLTVAGNLLNKNILQSARGFNITANSINNEKQIYAAGKLTLDSNGYTNRSGALTQSAGELVLKAHNASIFNETGAIVAGNRLTITTTDTIVNQGVIQGGQGTGSTLSANQLDNRADAIITLATDAAGDGQVVANSLLNAGKLQSIGDMTLRIRNSINDSGLILANGDLTVEGTSDDTLAVDVGGQMQAGGKLEMSGANDSRALKLALASGAKVLGGTFDLKTQLLTLGGNTSLSSTGDMDIAADDIAINAWDSRILGAMGGSGKTTIALSKRSLFTNNGLIYSAGDLSFSTPSYILNMETAGISAGHDLELSADNNIIGNYGALYAGNLLKVTASGGGSIYNEGGVNPRGTMNAGKRIELTAGRSIENSSMIYSDGDITVSAPTIVNEVYGGDQRVWGSETEVYNIQTKIVSKGLYASPWYHEAWEEYERKTEAKQYYRSGKPTYRPQILGTGNVTFNGFSNLTNLGGEIWGGNLVLSGNGSALVVNDAYDLNKRETVSTYAHYIRYEGYSFLVYEEDYNHNLVVQNPTYSKLNENVGAGIFAKAGLTGSGFTLVNGSDPTASGKDLAVTVTAKAGEKVEAAQAAEKVSTSQPCAEDCSKTDDTGGVKAKDDVGLKDKGVDADAGSTVDDVETAKKKDAASTGNATTGKTATVFGSPDPVAKVNGQNFGGINIVLPSNPNGYFVTSKSSSSHYLVETNPLYLSVPGGANGLSSDYLSQQLGYDPDNLLKRLGDGGYEEYLIRQQLSARTGRSILAGYASSGEQMAKFMDNAVAQSKDLGLVLGREPTAEQLSHLGSDIVWLVETVVSGSKVLAPVVYLSEATRKSIVGGAVIEADSVNLNVNGMVNAGGTISGKSTLNVVSTGDIVNLSGAINGGDVSLKSTAGSIINKTLSSEIKTVSGTDTVLGKTATITSTGTLALDAARDIKVIGAQVTAGGDASLKAKGDVSFDTIEARSTSKSSSESGDVFNAKSSSVEVLAVKQIKSGLSVGGDLQATAGKDITLAGTDATIKGNAVLDAGGAVKVISKADTTTTKSKTEESGLGVGGGLWGTSTVTEERTESRNVASTLNIGGNASIKAGEDMTLQGSKLNVAGNAQVDARSINVLDGLDGVTTKTEKNTTSILKITSGTGSSGSKSAADASSSDQDKTARAQAGASASASAQGSGGLAFVSNEQITTNSKTTTSVASAFTVGGNADLKAKENLNVTGSKIDVGGDLAIDAKKINVQAGRNESTTTTSSTTTNIGLMASSSNSAGASADAAAKASDKSLIPTASASANAAANAKSESGVSFVQVDTLNSEQQKVTNVAAGIKSGGDLKVKAEELKLTGSTLEAGGDASLKVDKIEILAAKDSSTSKSSSTRTSIGLLGSSDNNVEAGASADPGKGFNAKANVSGDASSANKLTLLKVNAATAESTDITNQGSALKVGGNLKVDAGSLQVTGSEVAAGGSAVIKADTQKFDAAVDVHEKKSTSNTTTAGLYTDASAGAHANAELTGSVDASATIGMGYYVNNSGSSAANGSTKAVVSTLKTGGDLVRVAKESISDTGTAIEVGGNLVQSAKTITSKAAADSSYSSNSSQKTEGRVGMYAGASASAGVTSGAMADASVGMVVSADHKNDSSSVKETTAVVSNIKVGGAFTSVSSGTTSLEGTKIDAGGDVALKAGDLKYSAAGNTRESSSTAAQAAANLQINVNAESVVGGKFSASGSGGTTTASSSTAVVGGIASGGKIRVETAKDAVFEGTALESTGPTQVAAGGNVRFDAANSTAQSSSRSAGAAVSAGMSSGGSADKSEKSGALSASTSYEQSDSQSTTKTAAKIQSLGGLTVSSGSDARFEGTQIASGGDTVIAAKGKLAFDAAHDTASTTGFKAGVSLGASSGKVSENGKNTKTESVSAGLSGGYSEKKSDTAKAGAIVGLGDVKLSSGKDLVLEGTGIAADGKVAAAAGGQVVQKEAKSSSSSLTLAGGATVTLKNKTESTDKYADPKQAVKDDGLGSASGAAKQTGAAAKNMKDGNDKQLATDDLGSASQVAKSSGNGAKTANPANAAKDVETDGLGSASGIAGQSGTAAKTVKDGKGLVSDDGLGSASSIAGQTGKAAKNMQNGSDNQVLDDGLGSASQLTQSSGKGAKEAGASGLESLANKVKNSDLVTSAKASKLGKLVAKGSELKSKVPVSVGGISGDFGVSNKDSAKSVDIKGGKGVEIQSGVKALQ
ncbi:two-partner secretion domain-containing protein [Quatrionicoccus australiensis]|uniref:two-partner secretion domain-containing protein n=1 Tax=Quatrionicoccus australiensis TaxID=138118 RepID=UPI001CFBCD2D|nr:hemagglutinin repeat-containing protein [Quatrionicoccus australiensis]MCB4358596.1 hemagglutinin repeat-containing protein [Quatrionicoccus australiensis]